ncbi:FG-GAP-like repeat-containing protein [Ekhidna sp.]|uniref:FG-GAP-like repeat-containing protein n=1 Tax=Ekhidna sp. TaxID=2608089 RepID=UPI003CCBE9D8
MRKLLNILLVCPLILLAQQKPFINNITPTSIEVGGKVAISGSNLTNVTQVSFGGVAVSGANVTVVSDNLVEAIVPAGATHGSVLVRTSNNLVAESSKQFFISFSSSTSSSWKAEYLESIAPNTDAYDVCLCDLNSDGLNDVILTHNIQDNDVNNPQLTVYQNNSTVTSEVFNDIGLSDISDTEGFISTTCADIDGDGKPDAIFTSNTNSSRQIFIYQNTSTGTVSLSYLNSLSLSLPTDQNNEVRITRRVKASDIDGDGKLDLVVGNEKDNTIHIFPNTSSPGSFSFGSAVEIPVGNASKTGSIEIGDLDNDSKPDVVIVPTSQSNEAIYVLRNESIPGTISMSLQEGISTNDRRRNIVIADFDNDGLNDIAVTADLTTSGVGDESVDIYKNTTTGRSITFINGPSISIPSNLPWGIDAGDLNGDGKIDLAVATIGGAGTSGSIYVIENSSSSDISFGSATALAVDTDARNIAIGDLSGDAKPDLAYSHNVRNTEEGDLGIRINQTCIEPEISPESFSFCTGENFTLSATNVANGNYSWSISSGTGTIVSQSGNQATFNITSAADAVIDLQITGQGGCTTPPTSQRTVNYEPGSVSGPPTITVNDADGGSICAGETVTLTTETYDEYLWTLPDGSTVTTSTITINSASASDAGEYQLRVRNTGACSSVTVAQTISVSVPPALEITNSNLDNFCSNTSVTLQVPDYSPDFNYQWYRDGSTLTGETNTTLSASQSGDYRVDVINATDGCISETANYTVTAVAPPTSVANGPTEICTNSTASFTSASTGQGSFTMEYEWVVEDASDAVIHTATTADLDYTFTAAGSYEVILNTTYDDTEVFNGDNCEGSASINVTVSDPPSITLDQTDLTAKCQSDIVELGLSSPAGSEVASYTWTIRNAETNAVIRTGTSDTLQVNTPVGVDTVWAVLDITTTIGCQVKDSIRIRNFQSDLDISSTDFTSVVEFDSALLEDAISINLSANNAASNISWEPAENFSDPSGTSTIFFPENPVSIVTLMATDNNGCPVSTQVRIVLDNIRPKRTFSPNGDGMNDCWEILNIGDLGNENGCKVFVFDSRGRNITTKDNFEANDNCVWDGNFNNSPVPEGVYYFVLKCDASEFTKTGSILLAR